MWICLNATGGRDARNIYLLFLSLLFFCHVDVDADPTSLDHNDSAPNSVPSEESLQTSASDDFVECKNLTSDGLVDSELSIIKCGSTKSQSPIVPPSLLNGVLTCQPYQGISLNHVYFQLANAFFLLSHLAPNGVHGVLYLRCTLLVGCAFLTLWGWTIACWLEAVLWNALFVFINFIHVCMLLYRLRPVRFSKEIEEVYVAVFQPLRVSRHQFRKVLNCMKVIRQLKYQEVYAQEKVTKVDSLSLVLSGKFVVSQNGRALHLVFKHQFLDSAEWFDVSTDEFFQVSITTMEESRVLIWHRDKLKLSIINDQFLQAVFDHILGRDVVRKLLQVSDSMAALNHQHQNGQVIGFGGIGNSDNDMDAKLFAVKKADSQGITALISRQLQEESVPLMYSTSDALNNDLHRLDYVRAPYDLPLYPVCNSVRSSRI